MDKTIAANYKYSGVCRLLSVTAGVVLVGAGFLLGVMEEASAVQGVQIALVVSGCAFAVLGIAARHPRFSLALAKASLVILSITFVLTGGELMFRIVGYDFGRLDQPGDDVPIYYRTATLHAGEGIFRRPGPASWRGQVLCAYMRMHGQSEGPYAGERAVIDEYDALGFRNPTDLTDWEVVVAGDSFVEAGYLPYDDLLTTIAAKQLGIRIKNLGVSGTGPVSQTFYVKNYGKAASTKDAVLCFFEGNDLEDLSRENRNTESFRATGYPWQYRKQVSLLKAVYGRLRLRHRAANPALVPFTPNAFLTNANPERSMTVYGRPPVWDGLSQRKRETLARALANWADTARSKGMRPWLMYLPDSHRVFHGFIRYADTNASIALWKPGDFAMHLGAVCTNLDVGFINTFPALRRDAEDGRMPYNIVGDTHLSLEGAQVVAGVLADALKSGHIR